MFDRQVSTGEGGLPIKVGNDTIGGIAVPALWAVTRTNPAAPGSTKSRTS